MNACACFAYAMMIFFNGQLTATLEQSSINECNRKKPSILNQYAPADRGKLKMVCVKK